MTYSTYLREQASECISLAVATAGQQGTVALIDLAEDYFACASRWERQAERPLARRVTLHARLASALAA
jgi:hypothetical protein